LIFTPTSALSPGSVALSLVHAGALYAASRSAAIRARTIELIVVSALMSIAYHMIHATTRPIITQPSVIASTGATIIATWQ